MSVVDRFICRREGHKPSATVKVTGGYFIVKSYITRCSRCGKWLTIEPPEYTPPPVGGHGT